MSTAQSLFSSVPAKDYFHFFKRPGELENYGKKVTEFLNYKKEDVSVAADVSMSAVRYDARMPDDLKERITEWATAINLVGSYFKDEHKTMLWFQIPNPLLGSMAPRDMIRLGRFRKLLRFIQTALDENNK